MGRPAATAVGAAPLPLPRTAAPDTAAAEDSTRAGYRETAHIRHYYRTTQV